MTGKLPPPFSKTANGWHDKYTGRKTHEADLTCHTLAVTVILLSVALLRVASRICHVKDKKLY